MKFTDVIYLKYVDEPTKLKLISGDISYTEDINKIKEKIKGIPITIHTAGYQFNIDEIANNILKQNKELNQYHSLMKHINNNHGTLDNILRLEKYKKYKYAYEQICLNVKGIFLCNKPHFIEYIAIQIVDTVDKPDNRFKYLADQIYQNFTNNNAINLNDINNCINEFPKCFIKQLITFCEFIPNESLNIILSNNNIYVILVCYIISIYDSKYKGSDMINKIFDDLFTILKKDKSQIDNSYPSSIYYIDVISLFVYKYYSQESKLYNLNIISSIVNYLLISNSDEIVLLFKNIIDNKISHYSFNNICSSLLKNKKDDIIITLLTKIEIDDNLFYNVNVLNICVYLKITDSSIIEKFRPHYLKAKDKSPLLKELCKYNNRHISGSDEIYALSYCSAETNEILDIDDSIEFKQVLYNPMKDNDSNMYMLVILSYNFCNRLIDNNFILNIKLSSTIIDYQSYIITYYIHTYIVDKLDSYFDFHYRIYLCMTISINTLVILQSLEGAYFDTTVVDNLSTLKDSLLDESHNPRSETNIVGKMQLLKLFSDQPYKIQETDTIYTLLKRTLEEAINYFSTNKK